MCYMNVDETRRYEEEERSYARQQGRHAIQSGFVTNLSRVYEDQRLPMRYGFSREGVPLSLMLLLYPATIVYVPPMSKPQLEKRLQMPISRFVELQDRGLLKPFIGHPTRYADLKHLDPILERRPPSVWARGDEVAHAYANAAEYWKEARRELPLDSITRIKWVRDKWRRHYPALDSRTLTAQLKTEVCTNYVDLCIFGFRPLARRLLDLKNPSWFTRRLLELNEVATYPHLLGAGGIPNYRVEDAKIIETLKRQLLLCGDVRYLGQEAKILLDGLALSSPEMLSAESVMEFHRTGTAAKLWKALEELERQVAQFQAQPDIEPLLGASVYATDRVRDAVRIATSITYEIDRQRIERPVGRIVDCCFKIASGVGIGLAALRMGGFAPFAAVMAGAGGASFLSRLRMSDELISAVDREITDWIMSQRFGKLATNFWWIKGRRVVTER